MPAPRNIRPDDRAVTASNFRALATSSSSTERQLIEDAIVRDFTGLAEGLAGRFVGRGLDFDDLRSAANYALLKAIRGFHADRGDFPAYAKATINGELKRQFRDFGWSVRPPRGLQELRPRVFSAIEQQNNAGLDSSSETIAGLLHADERDVRDARNLQNAYSAASLDQALSDHQHSGSISDYLIVDSGMEDAIDDHDLLVRCCAGLSDEDRELIRLRYYDELTQTQIAAILGCGQMQISRRLKRLHDRMRDSVQVAEVAA